MLCFSDTISIDGQLPILLPDIEMTEVILTIIILN